MKKSLILISLLFPFWATAQFVQTDVNETIERIIEELANNAEQDVDLTELSDYLQQISETPLNINEATAQELEQLVFLSDRQIQNLLWFRRKYGALLSKFELLYVRGFTKQDVTKLTPFIFFEKPANKRKTDYSKLLSHSRNKLLMRYQRVLEQAKGYEDISSEELREQPNSRYAGDRNKLYVRYQYQFYNKVQAGFTAEKDPGEQFFAGEQRYGFDHYTGHVQVNDIGKMQHLILGDFQASFGQGLTAWSGYGSDKSSYVLNTRKKERGLSKYSSTDENRFLRGAATQFRFGRFKLSTFASYKKRDGSTDTTSTGAPVMLSVVNTGLHRTPNEIDRRKNVEEYTLGNNLKFEYKNLRLGLTAIHYGFSHNQSTDRALHDIFDNTRSSNTNVSLDYDWQIGHHRFFGETAIDEKGALATLNGANLHMNKNVDFSVLHRYYDKEYQAFYGNAFGENSAVQNEQGLYFGLEVRPAPKWKLAAFADSYEFPWLSHRNSAPQRGREYFVELEYAPKRDVVTYLRFRTETKDENLRTEENPIAEPTPKTRWTARWHISYRVSEQLRFKNRIELAGFDKDNVSESGYLIYQDIDYNFQQLPLGLNFRFALFETTYNTRLYAYENDVLYAFSVPSYNGNGYRTYLNLTYDVTPQIRTWLRIGTWVYTDRSEIGSGLDEIQGDSKSEVKLQVRFKF